MNLKNRMILEEYRAEYPDFVQLGETVFHVFRALLAEADIQVMAVEHRVKAEESLAGKLELKGEKYATLEDITDILGTRIICLFSDDVDRAAALIEKKFDIDWENSVDKRAQLDPNAFGYLSLHYIASLPEGSGYPDNICGKKFEIQIRSTLQHTWAAINHDLGYKSDFGIPREVVREFSRLAGLLEIADGEFVSIRDNMRQYGEVIRRKIANNEADSVLIDMVSLREYMLHNQKMRELLQDIADICGAEISDSDPENYLVQLDWLGKKTIGDLQNMLEENRELALCLARAGLENSELDILISNVGLRFLCRAELLRRNTPLEKVVEFMKLSVGKEERAQRQAKRLLASAAAQGIK